MSEQQTMISITDAAAERVKTLMAKADKPVTGLRVTVKERGCSGLMYEVDYADEKTDIEDVIESKGVRIFIEPKAVMYLFGSEMDYIDDKFHSGFVFTNPNEKGRCGCGESFFI